MSSNTPSPITPQQSHAGVQSSQLKCRISGYVVAEIVGIALVVLGGLSTLGAVGSVGFIGSIAAGGTLSIASLIGALITYKKSKNQPLLTATPSVVDSPGTPLNLSAAGRSVADASDAPPDHSTAALSAVSAAGEDLDPIPHLKKHVEERMPISQALKEIPRAFFKEKSQVRAKEVFTRVLQELCNQKVEFPKSGPIPDLESLTGQLDREVFHLSFTKGVQVDIPRSSRDNDHIHVYQIASQYNAAEAAEPFTPFIGDAMRESELDRTQGPLAQRTNPIIFELVTAFLTHLGFNMLHEVVPSAGYTYGHTSAIEHGYLRFRKSEEIEKFTNELKSNFAHAEYVCYSSLNLEWGSKNPVYLLLQAAPAVSRSPKRSSTGEELDSDELQKYAALANYLALFRHGIYLARKNHKLVVLHANAIGGGDFGNANHNIQWGFEKAALALQKQMKEARVCVQLEQFPDFAGRSERCTMENMAKDFSLVTKERIGDS